MRIHRPPEDRTHSRASTLSRALVTQSRASMKVSSYISSVSGPTRFWWAMPLNDWFILLAASTATTLLCFWMEGKGCGYCPTFLSVCLLEAAYPSPLPPSLSLSLPPSLLAWMSQGRNRNCLLRLLFSMVSMSVTKTAPSGLQPTPIIA